jgi:hypothetical protein
MNLKQPFRPRVNPGKATVILFVLSSFADLAPEPAAASLQNPTTPSNKSVPAARRPTAATVIGPQTIEGVVRTPGGTPASGAMVVLRRLDARVPPLRVKTDAGGTFRFVVGSTGAFGLSVQADGLAPQVFESVRPGKPLRIVLGQGLQIEGSVRDVAGRPVVGARITAKGSKAIDFVWEPPNPALETHTDGRGHNPLAGLGSDFFTIAARATGFLAATKTVRGGNSVDLTLFAGGAALTGSVVDPSGSPVDDAIVRAELEPRFYPPGTRTATDAHGRFELAGLAPGSYQIVVYTPDHALAIRSGIVLEASGVRSESMVLDPGARVTGRIVDSAGRPLAGSVALDVQGIDGAFVAADLSQLLQATADAVGRFTFARLAPGSYSFVVTAPRYGRRILEFEVPNSRASLDLGDVPIVPGLTIGGLVTGQDGAPIADARVSAVEQSDLTVGTPIEDRTDPNGVFSLAGLRAGSYIIRASSPGFAMESEESVRAGTEGVHLRLSTAGGISGLVLEDADRPAGLYQLRITGTSGTVTGQAVEKSSSDDGRFVVENLGSGTYIVQLFVPNRAAVAIPGVHVVAGRVTDLGVVRVGPGGAVSGTVVDSGGVGIAAASVRLQDAARDELSSLEGLVTDSGGRFAVAGVSFGPVLVSATHPNFSPVQIKTELRRDEPSLDVQLVMANGGTIEGTAKRRSGTPLAGYVVSIAAASAAAGDIPATQANSEGAFRFEHIPAGRAVVTLLAPVGVSRAIGVQSQELEVRDGETTTVAFASREVEVLGHASKDGRVLAGLNIEFVPERASIMTMTSNIASSVGALQDAGLPLHATTLSDGSFGLTLDQGGRYRVVSRSRDGRLRYRTIAVEVPEAERFTLRLDLTSIPISGVVVDQASQRPVTAAMLEALPKEDQASSVFSGQSSTDGRFDLEVTATGKYRVTARADGYAAKGVDLDLTADGSREVRIELDRGLEIVGQVVDLNGNALNGVKVEAVAAQDRDVVSWGSALAGPDGQFKVSGLGRIPHSVCASTSTGSYGLATAIVPGQDPIQLTVSPGGQIQVTVRNEDGTPSASAVVTVVKVNGVAVAVPDGIGISDASGQALISSPAGAVEVEVSHDSDRAAVPVLVNAGTIMSTTVQFTRKADSARR